VCFPGPEVTRDPNKLVKTETSRIKGLNCECGQCMPLVEECKSVEMMERLETGIDITEKVFWVAGRHVAELFNPKVGKCGRDWLHHLCSHHLRLQTGRIDLAVEVHLIKGWGLGAERGQGIVVEFGGLGSGADQVWGLTACELGLAVRGQMAKVGLTQLGFHILARRKCDAAWAWRRRWMSSPKEGILASLLLAKA